MATLTETAHHTRRLIKFGFIGIVCLLVLRSAYGRFKEYWLQRYPSPPPKPTVAFGRLPTIPFPEQEKKEYVFQLETISGGLPELRNQAKVYFVPKGQPEFYTLERAKKKAALLGFPGKTIKISDSLYHWTNQDLLLSTLEMDILDGNFVINRNWQENLFLIAASKAMRENQAETEVKGFLSRIGLLSERLINAETKVTYLRHLPPSLVPAVSFSEADLTQVELFPAPLDNLPSLTPDPSKSVISFFLKDARSDEEKFLQVEYRYQPVLAEKFATYPLKTTAQAFSELQAKEAYIFPGQADPKQVVIRNIYLAYFETATPINYLMPIFVFQGDQNFFGYVSAVSNEWVEE